MTPQEKDQALRDLRKPLVIAAEAVMRDCFGKGQQPNKSQLSHLASACREATCAEEIENYLRYQGARGSTGWKRPAADSVIEQARKVLPDAPDADELRVRGWQLYATYLSRALTYETEARKGGRS